MPLRHLLYPGNVSWTEEGHAYSWQMKLRAKRGEAEFIVRDPLTDRTWRVDPEYYLTSRQARKMSTRPDMILQFAHYLADHWKSAYNVESVEVNVISKVSLNGRKAQSMVDPSVDLARIDRSLKRADWILPLTEPFQRSPERYRAFYRAQNQYR